MTADVRQQLTEALDSAEGQIDMRADDPHRTVQIKIRGAWRFMDQSVAAGLVERDREMLRMHENAALAVRQGSISRRNALQDETAEEILAEVLNELAAFWLGTPEPAEDDAPAYDPDDDTEGLDPRDRAVREPDRRLGTPEVDHG